MAISDPKENPEGEGMGGDELSGKGPFPSLPGRDCSPDEKQAHFSLSGWSVQWRIHLVFISPALTLMARHRGLCSSLSRPLCDFPLVK